MARPRPALLRALLPLALLLGALVPLRAAAAETAGLRWADVPAKYWAKGAIDTVARANPWMTDYGATHFRPDKIETRRYLAHALVLEFAPAATIDPSITFKDMAPSDPFYRFANVAVKLRWIPREKGSFLPDAPVTLVDVHKAIVRALGLWDVARGIDAFHTTDGYTFHHQRNLGSTMIGMLLGLRFNHSEESLDVRPDEALPRSEVAWSLAQAHETLTKESWKISSIRSDGYRNLHVGPVSRQMRKVIEFGLRYVGYPYVYAGEWPTSGFDCSGLTWWLMKAPSGSFDNTAIRGYEGWSLPQRSSRDMASVGTKIGFKDARAGDLMFYSSAGPHGTVDHVDTYIGYGWALDSSSGIGGVTVMHVDDGWYRDHFVHARRLIPTS